MSRIGWNRFLVSRVQPIVMGVITPLLLVLLGAPLVFAAQPFEKTLAHWVHEHPHAHVRFTYPGQAVAKALPAPYVTLRKGTPLILTFLDATPTHPNNNTTSTAGRLRFKVAEDVRVNGHVIARQGTPGLATITSYPEQPSQPPVLVISGLGIPAVNGTYIPLRVTFNHHSVKRSLSKTLYPLLRIIKGPKGVLPGTRRTVFVSTDIPIPIAKQPS